MGVWDEYCTVCGGPLFVPFHNMAAKEGEPSRTPPPPNPKDYAWLASLIGISEKEELVPLDSYDSYGGFDTIPDTSPYTYFRLGCRHDYYPEEETAEGYACHVACYNLLQKELNYTLKYADLLPLLVDNDYDLNKLPWTDYGGLVQYQDQSFMAESLVRDEKLWMIEDPSQGGQNKERILQLWRPLVESGLKRPDARAREEGRAPEIAENEHGPGGEGL